jgi:hypothetical protein
MARTSYLSIPVGQENFYWQALQPGDRFQAARIRVKNSFLSRQKFQKLAAKSYLPALRDLWANFTEEQRAAWKAADFHARQHGWRTFVADQSKRIKLNLPGVATPSIYHQDMVGEIYIASPATEAKLIQPHPYSYWVARKVAGKKSMYEPVEIQEIFSLPLSLGISFKSNLSSAGPNPSAKFYAKIEHLYQGQNLLDNLEINIPLVSDWTRATATSAFYLGLAISYNLYIELHDVVGTLWFDDVVAQHNGQNWARDIFCSDISKSFTRAFYQVPENWAAEIMPEGAEFGSVYPE